MLRSSSRTGAVDTGSLGGLPASDPGSACLSSNQEGGSARACPWLDTCQPTSLPPSIARKRAHVSLPSSRLPILLPALSLQTLQSPNHVTLPVALVR